MLYDDRRAEVYDDRYRERFAEAEEVASFLAALLRPPGPALELGIGTGRLALPLVARGVEVHGIDASPAMVARLRAKPGGDAIPVVVGDFADVGTLVDRRYPLVLLAYNSLFELSSQDDQVRCFQGVASRLVEGGILVVEAIAPDLSKAGDAVTVVSTGEDAVRLQVSRHDPLAQVVTGQTLTFTDGGVELWPWMIRYATVPEIDLMARVAGLRLRRRFGGWAGEPFTEASARHVSVYEAPGAAVSG
ncbi:MAG TPA: class I SAM-dependent methyltransferase [Acidimicrobiales bacterium]|nr:class I SAM-dependent methyltransferase [Acidimicrobiales bacterium]